MRICLPLCILFLVANALAEPVRSPQVPPPAPAKEQLAVTELDAWQAQSVSERMDRLAELSEVWQKSFREGSPDAPAHFDALAAEAKAISTTYTGTTSDSLAAFRLASAYELQRKHDHAIALFQQVAKRFGGTTHGSIALAREAEYRLRWDLDLVAARDAASRVTQPPEPNPDEQPRGIDRFPVMRSTYHRAQIALARIDAREHHPDAALTRLHNLPATVQNPEGEFSQELRLLAEDLAKATKE